MVNAMKKTTQGNSMEKDWVKGATLGWMVLSESAVMSLTR